MGLKGKLIGEVEVRSCGDLFHDLFATKPHEIATISPIHIQACDIHDGEFGKPGSTLVWNYTLNGKACVGKEVVESIDVEKKSITKKVVGGDLKEGFASFLIHIHVTPHPDAGDINLVTWLLEYEKLHENVPHPTMILDLVLNVSNHIDKHHLKDA
ncbi:hypothetical protein V2J09_003480 [Rumex salicifolius]